MDTTISVSGMTCGHCAQAVTAELSKIAGVSNVNVDVETGKVEIASSTELNNADIAAAIEEAGYELV